MAVFLKASVNRGERVEDALFRELKEEIGLDREDVSVLGSTQGWLRYRAAAAVCTRPLHWTKAALVLAQARR